MFITGMHRSGTSATASMAVRLGLRQADKVLPAHLFNPGGHFESEDLYNANERILKSLNYSWDLPPEKGLTEIEIQEARRSGVLNELRSSFGSWSTQRDWCDKDPRLAITLPVWDQVLLRNTPVIVCIRDPYEVANSLRLREGIPLELGIIIWRYYNQNISRNCIGRETLVVNYNKDMITSPQETAESIYRFAMKTGYKLSTKATSEAAAAFDENYRRNKAILKTTDRNSDWSKRMNEALECYERMSTSSISEWEEVLETSEQLRREDEQWMMLYRQARNIPAVARQTEPDNETGRNENEQRVESNQSNMPRRGWSASAWLSRIKSRVARRLRT